MAVDAKELRCDGCKVFEVGLKEDYLFAEGFAGFGEE